jgi:hypothetical protein
MDDGPMMGTLGQLTILSEGTTAFSDDSSRLPCTNIMVEDRAAAILVPGLLKASLVVPDAILAVSRCGTLIVKWG